MSIGVVPEDLPSPFKQLDVDKNPHLRIGLMPGDGMRPLIDDGAPIVIDTSYDRIKGDGVYVLFNGCAPVVVRITCDPTIGSRWCIMTSDNPLYQEQHEARVSDLTVIGRVTWVTKRVA